MVNRQEIENWDCTCLDRVVWYEQENQIKLDVFYLMHVLYLSNVWLVMNPLRFRFSYFRRNFLANRILLICLTKSLCDIKILTVDYSVP